MAINDIWCLNITTLWTQRTRAMLYIGRFCFSLIRLLLCVCVLSDIYLFDLLGDCYAWRVPFNELQWWSLWTPERGWVCVYKNTIHMCTYAEHCSVLDSYKCLWASFNYVHHRITATCTESWAQRAKWTFQVERTSESASERERAKIIADDRTDHIKWLDKMN